MTSPTTPPLKSGVYKYLSGWGRRVQKSVFECELRRNDFETVAAYLREQFQAETDRCHIYRLCAECIGYRTVFGDDLEPDWGGAVVL